MENYQAVFFGNYAYGNLESPMLFLFFEGTEVLRMEEVPLMSIWGYIGTMGGNIGVFLGLSGYSLIQFVLNFNVN